jgi:hypothetical protein
MRCISYSNYKESKCSNTSLSTSNNESHNNLLIEDFSHEPSYLIETENVHEHVEKSDKNDNEEPEEITDERNHVSNDENTILVQKSLNKSSNSQKWYLEYLGEKGVYSIKNYRLFSLLEKLYETYKYGIPVE